MLRNIWALLLLLLLPLITVRAQFDVIIKNGRIIDGSGNPWYEADVGILDGRIVAIGRLDTGQSRLVLDARGMIVAPGFIDGHTHSEGGIRRIPTADNFLFDGVTSIVTGNCGGSVTAVDSFFTELRGNGISINLATLIGHNSVRREVMGTAQRDPSPEEMAAMEAHVEKAMRQGAIGLSTGLIYIPGTYSKTAEVVALAKAAAKHNGIYASHIRNEGNDEQGGVFAAITEAIDVGRAAGMPVEISHFKVSSKRLWGQSKRTIALVEKARAEGLDVTVDQYPYTASSTSLSVLIPSWALADGDSAVKARLNDPKLRKKILDQMRHTIVDRNGRYRLDYAYVARCEWDSTLNGKNISQINRLWKRKRTLRNEIQTVLDMVEKGGAGMVYHTMSEDDVQRIMRYPYSMVASDAGVIRFGSGVPHPRGYGSNARVLAEYVRNKKVLRMEEAIRKMTSFPAQRYGLVDRGLIRPGMWADIVVFDEKTVADKATFRKPHAYSEGFAYVLVNGETVIDHGVHTGARPGKVLLGPGVTP
ncbi:MAG: D-aminoacylase [Ignavibacteria bacterium]|nr:D-aminoacylase [Ignavibacteria bacterium]